MEKVANELAFMATSCCPSWSVMSKKMFPVYEAQLSMALTPMVFKTRLIRENHPNAKIVFIGPVVLRCAKLQERMLRAKWTLF